MIVYVSVSDVCSMNANTIHTVGQLWGFEKNKTPVCTVLVASSFSGFAQKFWVQNFGVKRPKGVCLFFWPFKRGRLLAISVATLLLFLRRRGEVKAIYSRNQRFLDLYGFFLLRFKFCFELHKYDPNLNKKITRIFDKARDLSVVTISNSLKKKIQENDCRLPVYTLHDSCIPFHELARFDEPRPQIDENLSRFEFSVGFFGTYDQSRGSEIVERIAQQMPSVGFHVFGQSSKTHGAAANIIFHGLVSNLVARKVMKDMDILLMPYTHFTAVKGEEISTAEVMSPMKMFEYLDSGKPIVSSDLAVLREVLNTANAYLVEVGAVEKWVEVIKNILSQEKIHDLTQQVENYSWKLRAKSILDILGLKQ